MTAFPFVWLFAVTFVATVAAMPLARALGTRLGLMDHPHQRKLQTTAVPRTGGIGILLGLTAGTVVLLHLSAQLGIPVSRELIALFAGGVILHVTGVLDDLYDLPAKVKLAAQTAAVGIVISQGVVLERLIFPGGAAWEFGVLAMPITAFFLLGFINAINLVDGLDGLASGIVGIGALALGTAGVMGGNYLLAGLSTIVFAAVLGFLPFNLRKEKTFLGDAGSMLLGYLLGVTAIAGAWFSGESIPVFIGLASAAVPILDTTTTIIRRARAGGGLFQPDSMHIHHRLVRFGLSPRRTVLTILAVTLFCGGQAVVFFVDGTRALVVSTSLAAVLAALQILHRRKKPLAENDSSFSEILFYLLGAQGGRGPLMDEKLGMSEVIAAVREAEAVPATVGPPPHVKPRPVIEIDPPRKTPATARALEPEKANPVAALQKTTRTG